MKKINTNEVKSLLYEVITNAVKSLKGSEFRTYTRVDKATKETKTYTKIDTVNRVEVYPLATTFKRFVAKTAKTVKVYVERTYDRSKHDYYTTILVLVDNKPELLLPSMFVDRVVAAI